MEKLPASYEPKSFEDRIYKFWEDRDCFRASDHNKPDQKAFCMVIPPPNVTGALHMGHALTNTIQDILVRWHRMQGENVLWLPGTDHAGISTQTQVEKAIAKEGKGPTGRPLTRHDLGREKFLERVWAWKEEYGTTITGQLRRLGSSLDWSRERFTLDEGLSKAVREVFVRLYEEGLIYRGERIINWCSRCQTALSDLEVVPVEKSGSFWHLAYPVILENGQPHLLKNGKQATLLIATTRPETLLGDTAVAVHPDDERYQDFIGKWVLLPLVGRQILIIADEYVDREFGSGALKVTPAHDFNDYDLGKKHELESLSVMGKDGKITDLGGTYAGMTFSQAREKIIQDLADQNVLVKTEKHTHKVGVCDRCQTTAEPLMSKQWFVKTESLAKPAIEAVETKKIEFLPPTWEKTYFEWMHNIRDWCISRQLWWGHQIPAWHCEVCQGITVARETPKQCQHCQGPQEKLIQEDDVLDTWFSSALWPFSTLGWPEQTDALRTFYPTAVLETGFDIIFFWVARMIMMGMHFMGDVPFHKVYLHAMVRDEKGEKMSKTKGNVINPLDLMDKHGTDSLRLTLSMMSGQGRDIKLSVDRVEGYQAFCNKLWNGVKFLHHQLAIGSIEKPSEDLHSWLLKHSEELLFFNRWILTLLQDLSEKMNENLRQFELQSASQAFYEFTWYELCDWFIEFSKPALKDENTRVQTLYTLHYVLEQVLKLSHPFIPFVTEELWQSLPWRSSGEVLMLELYPTQNEFFRHAPSVWKVLAIKKIVEALRNFRGENRIAPKLELAVQYAGSKEVAEFFTKFHSPICNLARVKELKECHSSEGKSTEASVLISLHLEERLYPLELRIDLQGLVDVEAELKRISKEIERCEADLKVIRGKLSQEKFVKLAPPELVEKERNRESEVLKRQRDFQIALERVRKLRSERA